jgi:hypothetical protein
MVISFQPLIDKFSSEDDCFTAKIKKHITSFIWKLYLLQYHLEEVKNIISDQLNRPDIANEYTEIFRLLLESTTESIKGKEFNTAVFKAEAHLIAFSQTLHSTADIFSQIIYSCLKAKTLINPICKNRVSIKSVSSVIFSNSDFGELSIQLDGFLKSYEFLYVEAFANTTKHRSLIPIKYTIDFFDKSNPRHGLNINSFSYNEQSFDSMLSNELLKSYHDFFLTSYQKMLSTLTDIC